MNERKYRYKKAKNTKEYIEAIYEDLTYSSKENYYTNKTIKDYLSDILSIFRKAIWNYSIIYLYWYFD